MADFNLAYGIRQDRQDARLAARLAAAEVLEALAQKFNPYHDEQGRFATGGSAIGTRSTEMGRIERNISDDSVETGALYDANGRNVVRRRGTINSFHFTPDEMSGARGGIITHNHPGNTSLSNEDVFASAQFGLAESRVATRDGVYSLKPPPGVDWSSPDFLGRMLPKSIQRCGEEIYKVDHPKIVAGQITVEQSNRAYPDNLWRRVAADIGIRYEFTPWRP